MKKSILPLMAAAALAVPAAATAQTAVQVQPITGTRLDISATGEVTRVPDIAIISTGVVTRAATATAAIQQNATRMERVRAALRRAGMEDRDIQTSSINLNPEGHGVQYWSGIKKDYGHKPEPALPPDATVTLTLTPDDPLIDGSQGKPVVYIDRSKNPLETSFDRALESW